MCIRDRINAKLKSTIQGRLLSKSFISTETVVFWCGGFFTLSFCLLYTSDAADERSSVDLGGRRIITNKITFDFVASQLS